MLAEAVGIARRRVVPPDLTIATFTGHKRPQGGVLFVSQVVVAQLVKRVGVVDLDLVAASMRLHDLGEPKGEGDIERLLGMLPVDLP